MDNASVFPLYLQGFGALKMCFFNIENRAAADALSLPHLRVAYVCGKPGLDAGRNPPPTQ